MTDAEKIATVERYRAEVEEARLVVQSHIDKLKIQKAEVEEARLVMQSAIDKLMIYAAEVEEARLVLQSAIKKLEHARIMLMHGVGSL